MSFTASVLIDNTPTFMPEKVPVSRPPPIIGTGTPSGPTPIRRLKNISISGPKNPPPDPTEKRPAFSRKNARFSGKNKLNLSKLICCSSAST